MRRDILMDAVQRIASDLAATGIDDVFESGVSRRPTKEDASSMEWISFAAFQRFSVATAAYGDAENKVLQILDLARLADPMFWQALAKAPERAVIYDVFSSIHPYQILSSERCWRRLLSELRWFGIITAEQFDYLREMAHGEPDSKGMLLPQRISDSSPSLFPSTKKLPRWRRRSTSPRSRRSYFVAN